MSLETLQKRVNWLGGSQLQRINKQKLRSLLWALKNDYNSRTIKVLSTNEIHQALINLDKLKPDYDRKIVSIPFDAQLEPGDIFQCVDDGSKWMVYLPRLTETAYLHADIIRCRYQLTVNDTAYDVYFQGMTETDVPWRIKRGVNFNELNWSGTIFIKNNNETRDYFDRFTKIKIDGKPYEIQVVDRISVPGIIELEVLEDYTNSIEELPSVILTETDSIIIGKDHVLPREQINYTIPTELIADDGQWLVAENDSVTITAQDKEYCNLLIGEDAIGSFVIQYNNYSREIIIDEAPAAVITGDTDVYPYDIVTYDLIDSSAIGTFALDTTTKAKIIRSTSNSCTIEILTSKKGIFNLLVTIGEDNYTIPIRVLSL